MKIVVTLAILMMIVGGIATSGSRAATYQETSVAFGHCHDGDSDTCRPLTSATLERFDLMLDWDDNRDIFAMREVFGDPGEGFWREFGGFGDLRPPAAMREIFDPAARP
ncbi:MAG: hypothetical protein ACRD2M_08355 [Terriglobales bacterium]